MGNAQLARVLIEELSKRIEDSSQYVNDPSLEIADYHKRQIEDFRHRRWMLQLELEKSEKRRKMLITFGVIGVFLIIIVSFFFFTPGFNLFAVKETAKTYSETPDIVFNNSGTYEFTLKENGTLDFVKLSGLIAGDGEMKIYLDNLLVVDSTKINSGKSTITGFALEGDSSSAPAESAPSESVSSQPSAPETTTPETLTEQPTAPETTPPQPSSSEQTEGGTPQNESISQQVTPPVSENITPENITQEAPTRAQEVTLREFNSICEETCDLAGLNLTKESYTLRIELTNARLKLTGLEYGLIPFTPLENITLPAENITLAENITTNETNVSITTLKVGKIVVGKPVRWKKVVEMDNPANITVELPSSAENVSVNKIEEESNNAAPARALITGFALSQENSTGTGLFSWLKNFFARLSEGLTGRVISEEQNNSAQPVEVSLEDNATQYEITYETPAPEALEENTSNGKIVTISAPDELNYSDVTAYIDLPREVPLNAIRLYHIVNGTKEQTQFDAYDDDKNGLIDYIEWNVPHLSNQTYEIVLITKAEHLDSSRTFIEDVYNKTRDRDDSWVLITAGHYIRATFQRNLTSSDDITLYARSNYSNATVQVYLKDGSSVLATFSNITSNQDYKIYLTNLSAPNDTFDLKVIGAGIEFDQIVDPSLYPTGVFFDGFESGSFATNNWTTTTGKWAVSTSGPHDGTYLTTKTSGDDNLSVNISTSGYQNISLSFWYSNEGKFVTSFQALWYNGTAWKILLDLTGSQINSWTQYSYNLTSDANNNPNVKFRFLCTSGNNRPCDLDDVNITGLSSAVTDNPPTVALSYPPADYVNSTSQYVNLTFNASVSDDFKLVNCTLWHNATGTWHQNQTQNVAGTSNITSFNLTNLNNVSFIWNIRCRDNASQTSWGSANRTVILNWTAVDTTPPASVTNLANISQGTTWIYWNWTNPTDSDFNNSIIYLNGTNVANTSNNYYNATGLTANTNYTIRINTKDSAGNVNYTNVTSTAKTLNINWAPTHTTPILSSSAGANTAAENLTCYNQSTSDADGDSVKNIFTWKLNNGAYEVLNMPFAGGSNSTYTKDYSGLTNNGNVSGAVWNSTGGYDGKGAYYFDGSNSLITVGHSSNLEPNYNLTIAVWFKRNGTQNSYAKIVWYGNNDISPYGVYGFEFNGTTNIIRLKITNASDAARIGSGTIDDNIWYFAVGTYDGSTARLYINGVEVGNSALIGPIGPYDGTNGLSIGDKYTKGQKFTGSIDDIRIYNKTLSAQQVQALYNNRTDLIVSQELSAGQNWTCQVTPNDGQVDGTTLSSNSLTIAAAAPENVTINETMKDAIGNAMNTTLEIDDENSTPVYNDTKINHVKTLNKGNYKFKIIPKDNKIKQIDFSQLNLTTNITNLIDIQQANSTDNFWFSVNPLINSTNITLVANGTTLSAGTDGFRVLEKCANWDFATSTCSGDWIPYAALMADGTYNLTISGTDPGFRESVSNCTAEDSANKGSFGGACNNATGYNLLYDDNYFENHTYAKNSKYGGVQIQSVNTSVSNCANVTGVQICYKWWAPSDDYADCNISVDAHAGASYILVNSSCPSTTEPGAIKCQDITSLENWTCGNFFGASGTRAQAISQLTRSGTSGNPTYTARWDVFYFNVTYNASVPNSPPTQSTPILNSTFGTNTTAENLTCYNQSTADINGDSVKNIYNWLRNGTSIMVLNMPFEGGSNSTWTKDYSGLSNNGNVSGAVWNSTEGYDLKGAYKFRGNNSYIDAGNSSALSIAGGLLTVSAWVKPAVLAADQQIISKGNDGTNTEWELKTTTANGKVSFRSWNGTQNGVTSNTSLAVGVWTHVVGSYNGTTYRIYINGVLDNSSTGGSPVITNKRVLIGAVDVNGVAIQFWNGSIDDIQLFNKVLSAEQINVIYLNRSNILLSQELSLGQNWSCSVTPNDGYQDGSTLNSNNVLIIPPITSVYPNIININMVSSINLNEGPVSTTVNVNFTAYDGNGASDLNISSAMINFTRAGEALRANYSCANTSTIGNYINFTCNVPMYWFDGAGTWNVTAFVKDSTNLAASNASSLTVNALTGFVAAPSSLAFGSMAAGSTNITSTNDPIVLNNTGNQNISLGNVQINATNLRGETNSLLALFANNFSVGIATGANAECRATNLSRGIYVNVSGAFLPRGNFSVNDGSTGQEQLYFCIKKTGSELIAQAYSTSNEGTWTIKILVVGFALAARKKRKKKNLIEGLLKIKVDLQKRNELEKVGVLEEAIKEISEKVEIPEGVDRESIPVTIFSKEVGALETLCRYMKENLGMSYHEIALALNRNDRTIWTACHKAQEKSKEKIYVRKTEIFIPSSILGDRKYTILEAVIVHLKSRGMRFNEIAKLVDRDQRNVWTIYSRALGKQN